LFATGVGVLLGALLLLAYPLALLLGSLSGIVLVARLGLKRFRGDTEVSLPLAWSAIAIVCIVISALYVIPGVGTLVATIVMLFGLGTLSLEGYRCIRGG